MGFQAKPEEPLFVPFHDNGALPGATVATGAGVVGSSHSERGLTWFGAAMAGHLLAMDQPAVAFRMVEVLLGRVEGFESTEGFTVDMGGAPAPAPAGELGAGTVEVGEGSGSDGEDGGETGGGNGGEQGGGGHVNGTVHKWRRG